MGEVTELILEGVLCQSCGVFLDDLTSNDEGVIVTFGSPRNCGDCEEDFESEEDLL